MMMSEFNTDFAQVEIDEQQVNLTRFSLFLPEKREFFLEGQGVFDFAGSGGGGVQRGVGPVPQIFFSRRVGISEGTPVPIQQGGRLMGRMGPVSMGLLNIQTEGSSPANADATNFSVVRVKSDVLRRSNVGLILTNRSPSIRTEDANLVYGADANMLFYKNLQLNAFLARSSRDQSAGDPNSYRLQLLYDADRWGLQGEVLKVGDAFNPEIGFLLRDDFKRSFGSARFSPRPTSSRYIRRWIWEASVDRFVNSVGILETQKELVSFRIEFNSSDVFSIDFSRNLEFPVESFEVGGDLGVPAGRYRFYDAAAGLQLGPQRKVSGTLSLDLGEFFDGHRTGIAYSGRTEISSQFAIEPRVSFDWISLPGGRTRITLVGVRPTLTITPRMFVSALTQYNSSTNALETNVRWRWEFEPGSDLFVVYMDGRDTTGRGFSRLVNRGLAIKFSRFFRF